MLSLVLNKGYKSLQKKWEWQNYDSEFENKWMLKFSKVVVVSIWKQLDESCETERVENKESFE